MILDVRPPKTETIAELNMMSIIDELTAAAIAHGLDKSAASWSVTGGRGIQRASANH